MVDRGPVRVSSAEPSGSDEITVGRARTGDVRAIRRLVDTYSNERRLLSKATVALYEDVQEFWVARAAGKVVGCGALHVMWEDLAEVRTVAVDPAWRGRKIGHRIVAELLATARELGVARVFCLTFETEFFASFGFVEIDGAPVPPRVYEELLRSYDEGVAEFLGLERVKPNTLGNSRMLLRLEDDVPGLRAASGAPSQKGRKA
ncbi:N-acetylglutamate synthase [Rugosimonospora africana]|uniref:N-acetylglutamate synthase n=1 Tax=Rugosimonospora africana TaxID=556532 RepID=A0A8J3QJG2_9ACTN|nr:N-acetylglutamate synthase [Rugosimonospora africana]